MKKITVIGGGTGSFVTLSGLKPTAFDLNAIVTVADSGGSTGRLRDEFGFQPVGDLRQALAAMAKGREQDWIQRVLLYRFSKGSGLEGHNLGNLILTALQDMSGSTAEAIQIACQIFRLQGHIYPITSQNIQLVIEYDDGTIEIGEDILDQTKHGGKRIVRLRTSPHASMYAKAKDAILASDLIILGPGDLYGSILPNLVVRGAKTAFQHSHATIIYVCNLMTRFSQTHQMTATDHLRVIEKYLGKPVDYIILNSDPIPKAIKNAYNQQHEYPVIDDLNDDPRAIRASLIRTALVKPERSDAVRRSYLRHDSDKLAQCIINVINKKA